MLRWPGTDRAIEKAYKQATTGDVDDALTLLRRAARTNDPSGNRSEAMGMILYQRGRWAEAASALAQALQMQPQSNLRLFYTANATARAGEWDKALNMLDEAAKTKPGDVAPLAAKCLILLERPDIPSAVSAFEQVRRIFGANSCQDAYSMGLLEQCADSISELPHNQDEK